MSRNIFITGGMGGIGQACVQKFVQQGDKVMFTFATEKANQVEAEKLAKSIGPTATALAIDMGNPDSIRATGKIS